MNIFLHLFKISVDSLRNRLYAQGHISKTLSTVKLFRDVEEMVQQKKLFL